MKKFAAKICGEPKSCALSTDPCPTPGCRIANGEQPKLCTGVLGGIASRRGRTVEYAGYAAYAGMPGMLRGEAACDVQGNLSMLHIWARYAGYAGYAGYGMLCYAR